MGTPTRYPSGVSNEVVASLLGNYRMPNPLKEYKYVSDFADYIAADWTVTATTGTTALVAGSGGLLTQTTAATANDIQHNLDNPASFLFTPGAQFWFAININLPDALTPGSIFGLQAGGTPFAPGSGVYFTKASGSNNVNLNINKAGVITTIAGVATLSNGVAQTIGFYYDGRPAANLRIFDNAGAIPVAFGQGVPFGGNLVGGTQNLVNLPTVTLSPAFGIQASTAVAKSQTVDFILAATEILR